MQPLYYPPWKWKHYEPSVVIYENCTILKPENIALSAGVRIDSMCRLEGGEGLSIGVNVHIGSGSRLNIGGGELIFCDHSGCSVDVVIATGNPDLSYACISAAEPPELCHVIRQKTTIGKYAIIFAGAILCPGVTVGNYAVIGAGSVVTHDVPAFHIVAGNPAEQIGTRKVTR